MKILIVQLGRYGDLILLTPMFSEIKKKYPDSEIHVLAGRKNYEILLGNPNIDKIIKYDKSILKIPQTLYNIFKTKYDYWIDPKDHLSKESRIIAQIARAGHKIGYNEPNLKKIYDIDLPETKNLLHHTQIGLNALQPLGIILPAIPPKPQLFIDNLSEIKYQNFINRINKKYILINLSASGEHKMPDDDLWINFINTINDGKYQIILNAAPNEHEIADKIMKNINNLYFYKAENIRDTFPIIKNAYLLISPDTALVHIASAFNTPLLALYSGMDEFYSKFHPQSDIQEIVRAENGDKGVKSIQLEQILQGFYNIIKLL